MPTGRAKKLIDWFKLNLPASQVDEFAERFKKVIKSYFSSDGSYEDLGHVGVTVEMGTAHAAVDRNPVSVDACDAPDAPEDSGSGPEAPHDLACTSTGTERRRYLSPLA